MIPFAALAHLPLRAIASSGLTELSEITVACAKIKRYNYPPIG